MDKKEFLAEVRGRIEERSILKHPFYQLWKEGKLTRNDLQLYAKQYYRHVSAFPQYLSGLHYRTDDIEDRQIILQNLMDEEQGENNHPKLWIDFGNALGVGTLEIKNAEPLPQTLSAVQHFRDATSKKTIAEGIAALYTYESQIPKVSEEKIRGLREFYGISDAKGLSYFSVHMIADVEHSAQEERLLLKYAADEQSQELALAMVEKTLDAYWTLLDGVYNQCEGMCY